MKINYLDLFSGIGGFTLGLQQAGFEFNKHYFSEIDKYAIKCYESHFPGAIGLGDISTIRDVSRLGKINLITFGFPCQDLSIAGKRAGLEGGRSGLFYEAARLIRTLKPDFFILENVKGLLTGDGGRWFERCLREIADLGLYECQWQLLNTSWFLPQNRERIYFVGYIGKGSIGKIFPIGTSGQQATDLQGQRVNTITTRTAERCSTGSYVVESELLQTKTKRNSQGTRVNSIDGNSVTLSALGGGQGAKTGLYAIPVLTPKRENKRQNGRRFKEDGEPAFTLTAQDQHGIFDGVKIRRLTPTECERLQGFPDGWTTGFSDSQRYKMIGNAVSEPAVNAVAEKIFKFWHAL